MSLLTDYEEAVAKRLIARMKEGDIPWRRPFEQKGFELPENPTTGRQYHGANIVVLLSEGRGDPRWMTFNQAKQKGWSVRKGESATQIGYFQFTEQKEDEHGILKEVALERPRFYRAWVFNAEQIEGIPERTPKTPVQWNPHERLEMLVRDLDIDLRFGGDKAFFAPVPDYIRLPQRDQFESLEAFSSVLLHEVGHWTGHDSRLKRDLSGTFGSKSYAFEELVAEVSSLMMGEELHIPHDFTQHASYIQSWASLLEEDPKALFKAAALAGKVKGYLLEHERTWTPEHAQKTALPSPTETQALAEQCKTVLPTLANWPNASDAAAAKGLLERAQEALIQGEVPLALADLKDAQCYEALQDEPSLVAVGALQQQAEQLQPLSPVPSPDTPPHKSVEPHSATQARRKSVEPKRVPSRGRGGR